MKYTPEKIEVLDEIEHILLRPTMFVGSVTEDTLDAVIYDPETKRFASKFVMVVPAIIKIIDEVLSNSIDEAIRTGFKHATKIDITMTEDTITIRDNGRGVSHEKEEKTGLPQAVAAFTKLRAGANFQESEDSKMGTYGVGSTLTNIFSKSFEVKTGSNGKVTTLKCTNNMRDIKYKVTTNKSWKGTKTTFTPDFKYFGIDHLNMTDQQIVQKRLMDLAVIFTPIKFTFNRKRIGNITFKQYAQMHLSDGEKPVFFEQDNLCVAILPAVFATTSKPQYSLVNGLPNDSGRHFRDFEDLWMPVLRKKLNNKYKVEVKAETIRSEIAVLMDVRVKNPKFLGQTKDRLTSYDGDVISKWAGSAHIDRFVNKIMQMPAIVQPIVSLQKLREENKEERELKKANRKLKKIKSSKLLEATSRNRNECSLFLCEGDSAVGQALAARDGKTQAFLPLRGKVMNVRSSKNNAVAVAKNQELQEIMAAVGLRIGHEAPKKLRYGRVYIMTDADYDGKNINTLLINFFYTYWPELFEREVIRVLLTPIVIGKKGNKTKRFYDMKTYENFIAKYSGWKYTYIKGLGSLTVEEYRHAVSDINEIIVTNDAMAEEVLNVVFGDDSQARKKWLLN